MRLSRTTLFIAVLALLAGVALVVWGLPGTTATAPAAAERATEGYYVWTVEHLKAGLARKDFTLVNVHIPFEGRISGTDLEIPYDKIDKALDRLPADKSAKIVLYCRSGRMSEIAAARLVELGFTNIASLKGGMLAWEEAGGKIADH